MNAPPSVNLMNTNQAVSPGEPKASRSALCLYRGSVMHARMKPVKHRFSYAMTSILLDIDRLDEADQTSCLFSVNSGNLVSFHEKDFGRQDGTSLRSQVDELTGKAGLAPSKQVFLLCYPRVLGYGFNPISVYFCLDETGMPVCLIYEVHNTFGESHIYVEPVRDGQSSPAGIRQTADKQFYVSPFLDMDMQYRFRIRIPDENVAIRILESDAGGPILAASFFGRQLSATSRNLLRAVAGTAGLTWKVTFGIHFEALKLWLKGLRIRPRLAHNLYYSLPGSRHKAKPADKRG